MKTDVPASLGLRLKLARKKAGYSQKELADLLYVTQGMISKIERGDQDRTTYMSELAHRLGVRESWLATGKGPMGMPSAADDFTTIVGVSLGELISRDFKMVPLLSWTQAGDWDESVDPHAAGYTDEWVPCAVTTAGEHTFALVIEGGSMEPDFYENEVVFIDPDKHAENKSYVVVKLDDMTEATIRQLIIATDGDRLLKASNPSSNPQFIEVNSNIRIVGTAISRNQIL